MKKHSLSPQHHWDTKLFLNDDGWLVFFFFFWGGEFNNIMTWDHDFFLVDFGRKDCFLIVSCGFWNRRREAC